MTKRLFIALELPESCRERLAGVESPIRGVRWLGKDQLHLTLAFLGDVTAEKEMALRERLEEVRVPSFLLPIEGVGTFGGSHPSVIWAGVGTGHPHLFALHKRVHDALFAAHFDPPLRAFHPHVTLARLTRVSAPTLRPFLKKHQSDEFALVDVTRFALMSSRPGPEGSTYSVEARYDLPTPVHSPAVGGRPRAP
jgi:2'-5' RNA ligase